MGARYTVRPGDAANSASNNSNVDMDCKKLRPCPQLPGTLLRIFIPAGTVINLLNLIEVTSPSGICLIIRIPLCGNNSVLSTVIASIKDAGGSVEFV